MRRWAAGCSQKRPSRTRRRPRWTRRSLRLLRPPPLWRSACASATTSTRSTPPSPPPLKSLPPPKPLPRHTSLPRPRTVSCSIGTGVRATPWRRGRTHARTPCAGGWRRGATSSAGAAAAGACGTAAARASPWIGACSTSSHASRCWSCTGGWSPTPSPRRRRRWLAGRVATTPARRRAPPQTWHPFCQAPTVPRLPPWMP
mmetsp:Transcript_8066/g.12684  ORF Transcript_8066/g.12684 Transcript_8066/m.12684 type:complete len:201 (+) Transcript_8066:651-1253(+)